jgi:hypothetical protein
MKWVVEDGIKFAVLGILEQEYVATFAKIYVKREECSVTIRWVFHRAVDSPYNYQVRGHLREMQLIPDESYAFQQEVWNGFGNGEVKLKLVEGCSYYFKFYFIETKKADQDKGMKHARDYYDIYTFQVAVPLSDEKRALLEKAYLLAKDPEEMVRHETNQFLKLQNTFGEMLKSGIEQIKSKKLSEDEEEGEIEDLKERLDVLKMKLKK